MPVLLKITPSFQILTDRTLAVLVGGSIFAVGVALLYRIDASSGGDLSIIALLLFLFLAGARYTDYQQAKSRDDQQTQMASFVNEFATEQGIAKDKIFFNTQVVSDGMIVKMSQKYYHVTISADQQSYTLTRAYLVNPEVKVVK